MKLYILLSAAVMLVGAQELPPGGAITPPRIIHKVEPQYSEEARKSWLEGTVLLKVVIDTDGNARDFQVLRTLGLGLDEQAIAAVGAWQFQPGVKGGQPVNVFAQIEVNFRLLEAKWHLARAEFHLPQGAARPVVEKAEGPRNADDPNGATATLTFDIDEKGEPVNLQIEKSSDEEWGVNVMTAVSKWKFTAASKDGNPISVSCSMDFVRGN